MVDNKLGELLYDAGWQQGVLLPALPWTVVYQTDNPLTKIAKAAKRQDTLNSKQKGVLTGIDSPLRGIASGITRKEDYLVIASQDCDLVSNVSEEPTIVAMRAFVTDNENISQYAGSNSAQYFLLDPERRLVAQSSILVLIEKPVLMDLTPELGAIDTVTKQRFARWVAHRFDRTAFAESVVGAVVKPILDNLAQMLKDNDPDLDALNMVKEIRLAKISGDHPYKVRLLFIIPESGLPDNGVALAHLASRMHGWFNPLAACLSTWDARHIYEISVGNYLDTQQIYLDHVTYRGRTIQGLLPPPRN
jgi:hypothetical protein